MYSSVLFFVILLIVGIIFPWIVNRLDGKIPYRYIIGLFSISTYILLFYERIYVPIILSLIFFIIAWLKNRGIISNLIAIPATLIPLVIVKLDLSWTLSMMVGLSFMTFRAIDVLLYSDKEDAFIVKYFTYLFLPLIILAGPMYRWRSFEKDMSQVTIAYSANNYFSALEVLILGIVQKFLLGWAVYTYIIAPYSNESFSLELMVVMSIGYSLYLYFDFAGYSNMARGAGLFFGLNIPLNFNNPIFSKNPQDFWQRFHISLSQWLKDVIFIPTYRKLSAFSYFKKHRLFAQNIAIFLTLFCMGIWNGLELHYIISGMLFGIYSVAHNILLYFARKYQNLANFLDYSLTSFLGRIITLGLISFSLYIFSGYSPL